MKKPLYFGNSVSEIRPFTCRGIMQAKSVFEYPEPHPGIPRMLSPLHVVEKGLATPRFSPTLHRGEIKGESEFSDRL
jgi:hypothetical protein